MGLVTVSFISVICSKRKFKITLIDGLIFCYALVILLISHFYHHAEINTKLALLILLVVLYFYLREVVGNGVIKWALVVCFIATGLVEPIIGLRQLYGFEFSRHHLFPLTGTLFNPGPYSGYVAMVAPMALYYAIRDSACMNVKFKFRYWHIYLRWGIATAAIISILMVLPVTMGRTAWLSCAGGCGVAALLYYLRNGKIQCYFRQHKRLFLWLVGVGIAVLALGLYGMYQLKKDSADGRALIWKMGVKTAMQHPMGVGIGNFAGAYGEVQAAYFASGKGSELEQRVAGSPEYGFNEYLQICAELGVIPFLLFLVIVSYAVYLGVRHGQIGATGSLIALLVFAFASYPFSVLPFLIALVFLLAIIASSPRQKTWSVAINPPLAVTLGIASLLVVGLCLYNRYPTYHAYKKWRAAQMLYSVGLHQEVAEEYKPLYPYLNDQINFLFEYGQALSKSEQYSGSNEVLTKAARISCDPMLYNVMGKNYQALKKYAKAEHCLLKSSYLVPSRIYPYYLLANLYAEMGEPEKAKAMARVVLTKEPKVQSTAVKEMRQKMQELLSKKEVSQE
jgi:tetratricopeptide (TPR) repeat protein